MAVWVGKGRKQKGYPGRLVEVVLGRLAALFNSDACCVVAWLTHAPPAVFPSVPLFMREPLPGKMEREGVLCCSLQRMVVGHSEGSKRAGEHEVFTVS